MNLEWYKMDDLKKQSFNKKTWTPLWSYTQNVKKYSYGQIGYEDDYFGAVSIMFPLDKKDAALKLDWMDVTHRHSHNPWIENNGHYYNANEFNNEELNGIYLLLIEEFETGNTSVWHLDQDLMLGLNLLQKGDEWICPREDDLVVAKLIRNAENKPIRMEIRAEHLRDYLCARNAGLFIAKFHTRAKIYEPSPELDAIEKQIEETLPFGKWRMDVRDIHEGNGLEYGAGITVVQSGHVGIEDDEDVPILPHPTQGKFDGESYSFTRKERRLKHLIADCWQNEWVDPSQFSPRVRGDNIPSTVSFIIDNMGTVVNSEELKDEGRWLWFNPPVVNELLSKPYSYIKWHSKTLGDIGRTKCYSVTFGMNDIGLVVVYAKDIAQLPEFDKKIWSSHNVAPDGGLSKEMHTTQVRGLPVKSYSPEFLIKNEIELLKQLFRETFHKSIFNDHPLAVDLDKRIHRFRAINREGIYLLCKEITRLVIERFDLDVLKQLRPKVNKEFKSLKRLELLVDESGLAGREILRPLAGIYELRHADSHLPSRDAEEAMKLIGIDKIDNTIIAGAALIWEAAKALHKIAEAIGQLKENRSAPE